MIAAVKEDGQHCLVIECVASGSLQDLLDTQGALRVPWVLEIALDLADALTRAHHLGIVHRDLKPANVLLVGDGTPRLVESSQSEAFHSGQDLDDGDVCPGIRVMAAYWISVEHEMKMRLDFLLTGSGHPEWRDDPQILEQRDLFSGRFLDDMRELVSGRESHRGRGSMSCWQRAWTRRRAGRKRWDLGKKAANPPLEAGRPLPPDVVEAWFRSCLHSVANYNQHVIWGAVVAAALVQDGGSEALRAAAVSTAEEFMWEISREFYVKIPPGLGLRISTT